MADNKNYIIINPTATILSEKGTSGFLRRVGEAFTTTNGIEYEVYNSRFPRDITGAIHDFSGDYNHKPIIRVYCVGGEGTLFECAGAAAEMPNIEIAYIPYGIKNDFLRNFTDITKPQNLNIFRNFNIMSTADCVKTDVISCFNNYAVNYCTIGSEAQRLRRISTATRTFHRNFRKFSKIHSKAITAAIRYTAFNKVYGSSKQQPPEYSLTIGRKTITGRFSAIHISNGAYYDGGKTVSPKANPADGVLDIVIMRELPTFGAYNIVKKFMNGQSDKSEESTSFENGLLGEESKHFMHFKARKITVACDEPFPVMADGEYFRSKNSEFKVVPNALNFVMPRVAGR